MWIDILMGIGTLIFFGFICILFYIGAKLFFGIFEIFMYMITLGHYNHNSQTNDDELKKEH